MGFYTLKILRACESPWPWLWQTPPVLVLSASWDPFLHSLPIPCFLCTRAALLMSFIRLHNSNQGCFDVSTVQAQQAVPDEHSNSSSTWPFLFLHEHLRLGNSVGSLGTGGNYSVWLSFHASKANPLVDAIPEAGPYPRLDSSHIMEKLVFT